MTNYRVPTTIVVQAESKENALRIISEELDYLFDLDNPLVAFSVPENTKDVEPEEE